MDIKRGMSRIGLVLAITSIVPCFFTSKQILFDAFTKPQAEFVALQEAKESGEWDHYLLFYCSDREAAYLPLDHPARRKAILSCAIKTAKKVKRPLRKSLFEKTRVWKRRLRQQYCCLKSLLLSTAIIIKVL